MNLAHLALIAGLLVVGPSAFGQGDTPDSCDNRYDGTISSFILDNSSGNAPSFDVMANPNMTVNVFTNASYSVDFVMHMPSTSSQNNTDFGSTWYHETASGFADGHCVGSVSPNDFIPVASNYVEPASQTGDYIQHVEFATFSTLDIPVAYNIHWTVPSTNVGNTTEPVVIRPSTSTLTIHSQDSFSDEITGYSMILYAANGTQIAQGFTPTTFTLDDNSTYFVSATSFGSFIFDHWLDNHSANTVRTINTFTNMTLTAIYRTVPQPPTGLTATANVFHIDLEWNSPTNNGGAPVTGYMIERSTDKGSTWSAIATDTGTTSTSYSDSNVNLVLSNYSYRVSAINNVGHSIPSNIATATTPTSIPIVNP